MNKIFKLLTMKLVLHVHFTLLLLVTCAGIHGEEDAGFCDKGDEGCGSYFHKHHIAYLLI